MLCSAEQPNWTHSAFPMESYGGYLMKFKTSNTNFEENMTKYC